MRKIITLVLLCLWATPAAAQLLLYDGFDYSPFAFLAPKTDTVATPNPGLHNVDYNLDWRYAGTGSNSDAPSIANPATKPASVLSFADVYPGSPGLPATTGNSVAFAQESGGARINVPTAPASGTTYWSGLFKVQSLGDGIGTGNSGAFVAGFNVVQGPSTGITTAGAMLYLRRASVTNAMDTTDYVLGTGANTSQDGCSSGGACTNRIFATGVPLAPGDTVFVVGAYNLVSDATQDDIASLWINPDPADFGAASPPTPTITAMSTGPASDGISATTGGVASFFLRSNNTVFGANQEWYFDELRVGSDWASVTPAAATLPGDLNGDGHVDAADYVFWRKNGLPQTKYDEWRANFGNPPGSGSSLGSASAVPEPTSLCLVMLAAGSALIYFRRTK